MAYYSTSGPDSSQDFSVAKGFTAPEELERPHEADLASLTAKFVVSAGTRISPELSADLALDIVLHEIAEQACLATGATGAAIVLERDLERDGEMVCRATSGSTSPRLGARMDADSGLSWECMHSRQVMRCDDTVSDPRADVEAARSLGVRSVMVLPILRLDGDDTKTIGLFEAFSSRPAAFGDRDQHTLEVLAVRVLKTLELAASPVLPVQLSPPENIGPPQDGVVDSGESLASGAIPPHAAIRSLDLLTGALASIVVLTALWLGFRAVQHLAPRTSNAHATKPSITPTLEQSAQGPDVLKLGSHSAAYTKTATAPTVSSARISDTLVPVGGLRIFENGKEVFRMPPLPGDAERPGQTYGGAARPASTIGQISNPVSSAIADSVLISRVEPEYPEAALQQQIQGIVVLDASIGADGTVEDVKVIRGPALLADAALAAVQQWRFKPSRTEVHGTQRQATISLNFRLPDSDRAESSKKAN